MAVTRPSGAALDAATEAVKAARIYAIKHPSGRAVMIDPRDEAYDVLMASGYPAEVERLREERDRWERLARRLYRVMGEEAERLFPGELEVLGDG